MVFVGCAAERKGGREEGGRWRGGKEKGRRGMLTNVQQQGNLTHNHEQLGNLSQKMASDAGKNIVEKNNNNYVQPSKYFHS